MNIKILDTNLKKQFGNIPKEWSVMQIQDICKTSSGGTPSRSNPSYFKGNIPWVKTGELRDGYIYETEEYISEEALRTSSAKLFPPNTVLFAMYGATIGKTAITKIRTTTNQACCAFLPAVEDTVDPYYLQQYLISIRHKIISKGEGAGQPNTSQDFLKTLKILYPPFQEQKKIASILSKVDELIQKIDEIIEQTQRLKKGLMQRLLTKGIGHTKFKKTELGEIPEEWKIGSILENSTLKGRIGWQGLTTAEYRQHGEYYLVTGTDFKDGRIDWQNCVYIDKERFDQDENIQLRKDDVLVTKDGTIGKIAFIDTLPKPTTLNSGVFVIRPINKAYVPFFFYFILRSYYFIKFLNRLKAGSTINHLYQKDFVNFSFPIPQLREQQKIASILSSMDLNIQKQYEEKSEIKNLKRGLMQKLLTGKIRVKV